MPHAPRPPILTFFLVIALVASSLSATVLATPASAHGSTQEPPSRVHACRFGHTSNPMCADAWAANSQALYDWMEVNIGDANGRHRELIPDGELCSAGRSKYGAFDEPGAWPLTNLHPNSAGQVELVYENTAPHSTLYYRVYITKEGFDARTHRLAWSDLELAHDTGRLNRSPSTRIQATLPARDIPAILYIVWQRSDSPEAFYACSDVTVGNGYRRPRQQPSLDRWGSDPSSTSSE